MINEILLKASDDGNEIIFHFDDSDETCEVHNGNTAIIKKNGVLHRSFELLCLPCGRNVEKLYKINYFGTDGRSIFNEEPTIRSEKSRYRISNSKKDIPPAIAFKYLVASSIDILKVTSKNKYVPNYEKYLFVNDTRSCIIEEYFDENDAYADFDVITTLIPLYFYYGNIDTNRVAVVRMRLFNINRVDAIKISKEFVRNFL